MRFLIELKRVVLIVLYTHTPTLHTQVTVAGFGAMPYIILNRPTGIVLDADENLFTVESGNHRILQFVSNRFQCLFGCSAENGSSTSGLSQPTTMAFDQESHIFVADSSNFRIQKFDLVRNSCGRKLTFNSIITIIENLGRFFVQPLVNEVHWSVIHIQPRSPTVVFRWRDQWVS